MSICRAFSFREECILFIYINYKDLEETNLVFILIFVLIHIAIYIKTFLSGYNYYYFLP